MYHLLFLFFFCTVHWADLSWPTFHYWLYPVWLCMWQINKNLENLEPWTKNRQRSYNARQRQKSNPKTGKGHIMQGRGKRVIHKQAKVRAGRNKHSKTWQTVQDQKHKGKAKKHGYKEMLQANDKQQCVYVCVCNMWQLWTDDEISWVQAKDYGKWSPGWMAKVQDRVPSSGARGDCNSITMEEYWLVCWFLCCSEARVRGVQLRWWQPRHEGAGHDQWALDHVEVILWVLQPADIKPALW